MTVQRRGRRDQTAKKTPPRSLALVKPAEAGTIGALRHAVAEFAAAHGAPPEDLVDIALVVSEAATNAVKHAEVVGGEGIVELTATVADQWLEIRIRDRGRGFATRESDGLGLGLPIIAALAAHLTISQEGHGTEIRMRFPLFAEPDLRA